MDAADIARIYAGVVAGGTKEQFLDAYKNRDDIDPKEVTEKWDQIAAEVGKIKTQFPNAKFDVPNEFPVPPPGLPDDGKEESSEPSDSPSEDAGEKKAPDGPAVSNLKQKASPMATPKAAPSKK